MTLSTLRQHAVLAEQKSGQKKKGTVQKTPREKKTQAGFHLSYDKEHTTWRSDPSTNSQKLDEDLSISGKHHVRAYATIDNDDDVDIGIGPELILKERHQNIMVQDTDQPNSQLGVGMQFKYNF